MERCFKHRKDILGNCMWCGKQLCQICIAFQEGRKLYCEECNNKLRPSLT